MLENDPPMESTLVHETPTHASPSPIDPVTPTKSKNPIKFDPVVIIDSPKNRIGLKRLTADSRERELEWRQRDDRMGEEQLTD